MCCYTTTTTINKRERFNSAKVNPEEEAEMAEIATLLNRQRTGEAEIRRLQTELKQVELNGGGTLGFLYRIPSWMVMVIMYFLFNYILPALFDKGGSGSKSFRGQTASKMGGAKFSRGKDEL